MLILTGLVYACNQGDPPEVVKKRLVKIDTLDTLSIVKVNHRFEYRELFYKSRTTGVTFTCKLPKDTLYNENKYHIRRVFEDVNGKTSFKEDIY